MKKMIKLLGVITLMVVIGFSMVSCNDEPEEEPVKQSITVTNISSMHYDIQQDGVKIELLKDGKVIEPVGLNIITKATVGDVDNVASTPATEPITINRTGKETSIKWSDLEVGEYQVRVTDKNTNQSQAVITGEKFTLAAGEAKEIAYAGTKASLK
jgi:PKD repeat protein